jgi:hypothetical protein
MHLRDNLLEIITSCKRMFHEFVDICTRISSFITMKILWLQTKNTYILGLKYLRVMYQDMERLCALVVKSAWLEIHRFGFCSGATRFSEKYGSETGSTQPREYNWGATWKKK